MPSETPFSVEAAHAHLKQADPVLARVIGEIGSFDWRQREDPYLAVVRTIMFQQLAGAAATAIMRRFFAYYGDAEAPPSPAQMLETTDEQFRSTGVSRQKAGYLRDLALYIVEGRLDFAELAALSDEDVTKKLTAVNGIGEWSAHMFLMFHLGRPDVLPVGDLGVRNGMRVAYGLEEMPTPKQALVIGAPWAPYRSVGSWYMWRVTEPVAQDI